MCRRITSPNAKPSISTKLSKVRLSPSNTSLERQLLQDQSFFEAQTDLDVKQRGKLEQRRGKGKNRRAEEEKRTKREYVELPLYQHAGR